MSTTSKSKELAMDSQVVKSLDVEKYDAAYFTKPKKKGGPVSPKLEFIAEVGKGEFYLEDDCFTKVDDNDQVVFYPKEKCILIKGQVFFKDRYVVEMEIEQHNPALKRYEKVNHVVTYSKQEYYEFFAKDRAGNTATAPVMGANGKPTGQRVEKEAPIKSGFAFDDAIVLWNADKKELHESLKK